jgi:hypothetical protein
MLPVAILVLLCGTLYAIYLAPPEEKVLVGAVVVALSAAGYGIGLALTAPRTDERTYYSIAAAIAGAMVAFGWISSRRKSWPKKD